MYVWYVYLCCINIKIIPLVIVSAFIRILVAVGSHTYSQTHLCYKVESCKYILLQNQVVLYLYFTTTNHSGMDWFIEFTPTTCKCTETKVKLCMLNRKTWHNITQMTFHQRWHFVPSILFLNKGSCVHSVWRSDSWSNHWLGYCEKSSGHFLC